MLVKLNEKQDQSVRHKTSCVVVAGPGTGKTYTLIAKLKHLLTEEKVSANKIIVLTFTKKAVDEINMRVGVSHAQVFVNTIHAWCYRLLKNCHPEWQKKTKEIASEVQQKEIVKKIKDKNERVDDLLNKISLWKQNSFSVNNVERSVNGNGKQNNGFDSNLLHFTGKFQNLMNQYQACLQKNDLVDFDDLLIEGLALLKKKNNFGYEWLLVDEFQDLNELQFEIVMELVKQKIKFFAVGDPYQSIYGFRGASPRYFNRLKWIKGVRIVELKESFRSGQKILDLSGRLFEGFKSLTAMKDIDSEIKLIKTHDEKTEAYWISKMIQKLSGFRDELSFRTELVDERVHIPFSEIAVLYRTRSLADGIKKQLDRDGVPYQVVGEKSLLEYEEVRIVVGILESVAFELSMQSVDRGVRRFEMGLFSKGIEIVKKFIDENGVSLVELIDLLVKKLNLGISQGKKERLGRLRMIAYQFQNRERIHEQVSVGAIHEQVSVGAIHEQVSVGAIHELPLQEFINEIKQLRSVDEYEIKADKVTLSTLHAVKGLEFGAVFIIGVEEGLLPYAKCLDDFQLEEERRLLYVGMTRSKQYLYLSCAKSRSIYGGLKKNICSRFLQSFGSDLLTKVDDPYVGKYLKQLDRNRKKKIQMRLF